MRNNGKLLLGGALLTATVAAAVALASIRAGAEDHATGVSAPAGPPAPTATGLTQESVAPQGAPRNGPVQMVYFTIYDDGILPHANNVKDIKEYDYDQTLKRHTVNTYVTGSYQTDDTIHLLGLLQQQSVHGPDDVTEVARTVNEYDVYRSAGSLPAFPDYGPTVTGHDSNFGTGKTTRGNLTVAGRRLNTTGTTIYSYVGYDTLGNAVWTKDARGNVTEMSFADDFGDGANPGGGVAGANGPTYALPTLLTGPPPNPGEAQQTAKSQ